ncbi:hypothetical protein M5X00_00250 [Paenibacillus alvei]|uniref:Uncharacterized protein n=1 Tax=Paenibacillus alvei TaxID=44250 RepID=A0ABT4H0V0_PAEAL|nr:hypothetical protein [Paenibacillus alvei]MCY9733589.1 hypothetical protein [Paenibacillus alvei]MCY9752693.1 hypothetical protein [Paenibacillus alvei]MCY9762607.1 hypothetical protein [Paenibacillus alvei]MCY9769193.1 hypothetical protein [Paenibacillus alvei]
MINPALVKRQMHFKYMREISEIREDLSLLALKFKYSIGELDILKWLHNFEEGDRNNALKILYAVDFLDETDLMRAYDEGLKEILNSFPKAQLLIMPVGEYGKSGTAMIYYLKKTKSYRRFQTRITIIQGSTQLRDNLDPTRVIVLLDDFFGSGNSVVEFYENHLKLFLTPGSYLRLTMLAAIAQKSSIYYLSRHLPNCKVFTWMQRDKAFSDSGSPFGYRKNRTILREMCYEYGKGLCIIRGVDSPLGYRNSQALVTFSYGTPNNSLPILWSDRQNWYPLFPRSFEPRMEQSKAFRRDTAHMLSIAKMLKLKGFQHFTSGEGRTDWKEYQFITRSDFLQFCFIRLKNQKRDEHIVCQLLGLSHQEHDQIVSNLKSRGLLGSDGRLTAYGKQLYDEMADRINHFKKRELTDTIEKSNHLYWPETFGGTR